VIEDGAVAIARDRIAGVGTRTELEQQYPAVRVLDARRRVVRPGYVDAHVHVTAEMLARGLFPDSVGQRAWIRDWATHLYAAIEPEEEYIAALLACTELLRNGVTAFCDGGTIKDIGQVARAVQAAGVRGVLGRWTWDRVPRPAVLRQTAESAIAATEDIVDRFHGTADGRVQVMAAVININTASERLLDGLRDLSEGRAVMLNFHQSAYADYLPEARAAWGTSPIEHLRDLGLLGPRTRLVHMNHVEAAEIDLLAGSDTRVVHCPGTAFRLAYGASTHGRFPEMLGRGITVGLGTDGADAGDQLDLSRAIYLAAGLFKDSRQDSTCIPAETALEMATLHGARSIGAESEIGSLEPGKKADLVLLDRDRPEMVPIVNVANCLVYATDGRSVHSVLVDGRIVVENGHVVTVDEAELFRAAERLSPRLVARSGLPVQRRWPVP
jgi:cytosine/adenosine deaminase-related metal-dependent hydrolase